MKLFTELFIANRLRLSALDGKKMRSPSLTIATIGITLAIAIMILSIAIVGGFKAEISGKIFALDSHIKVNNAALGLGDNIYTVHSKEISRAINDTAIKDSISSMSLIAEQPAMLKTENDFKGIVVKGVDENFDWSYLQERIVAGAIPDVWNKNGIAISQKVAKQLNLNVGDKLFVYFFNQKIKTRKITIGGIYQTDLEDFDSNFIMGNISLLQNVNGWSDDEGNYVGICVKETSQITPLTYSIFSKLAQSSYKNESKTIYNVTNTKGNNASYFSWLSLLDMNVIIIISLMAIVSAFTLISALLMIVLERIKMIGLLKTLGATNASIRTIFILLTQKIIFRAILYGNMIGLALAYIQDKCHLVRLNPEAYYMPYVPIEINWMHLLALNTVIIVFAYLTLMGPSHIISGIKPSTTLRYE